MFTNSDRQLLHAIGRALAIDIRLDATSLAMETHMSKELDDLTNEVEVVKTTQASAVVLINHLADLITEAGTDPAKLAALTADLKDSADQLALAVDAQAPKQPPIVS